MGFEAALKTFTALLVFLALDLQGACVDILISQTPSILTVEEGADAHVNCSLDTPQQISEAFFEWENKSDTILTCKMQNYSHIENCRRHRISASINWNSGFFMMHINSTQLKDNGTYYCRLQIERPVPIKAGRGNGTVLIVEASGEGPPEFYSNGKWLASMAAWLLPGIFLCALVTSLLLVRGRRLTGLGSVSQEARGSDETHDLPLEHETSMPKAKDGKLLGATQQVPGREVVESSSVPVRVRQPSEVSRVRAEEAGEADTVLYSVITVPVAASTSFQLPYPSEDGEIYSQILGRISEHS